MGACTQFRGGQQRHSLGGMGASPIYRARFKIVLSKLAIMFDAEILNSLTRGGGWQEERRNGRC